MPFTITMPKLSPTMEVGTITQWRKKIGDKVKTGEVLFEVATDKATVEYSALDDGYLRKILVEVGKEAVVNQAVAVFTEKADEEIVGYQLEGIEPKIAPTLTADVKEDVKTQSVAPVQPTGKWMAEPAFVPEPPLEDYRFLQANEEVQGHVRASPLAKKLAKDKGIDLSTVKGTGPHQRIVASDVDQGQPDAVVAFGRKEKPLFTPGSYEETPLTPMRKVISQRLQEAKTFIPHFYIGQEVRCDALHDLREQLKNLGLKVSFNDMIFRAVALALRQHPDVNVGYDSVKQAIIRFKTIDIAFAVNVPGGLVTPIVRHADFKNLGELSTEMKVLAARARSGKLEKREYVGGSFTTSNLGMYGISEFAAIINPPQVAILAIAGIEERPVVHDRQVVVGKIMRLTLSADHRVIDGALAAEFLKTIEKFLENPAGLLVSIPINSRS